MKLLTLAAIGLLGVNPGLIDSDSEYIEMSVQGEGFVSTTETPLIMSKTGEGGVDPNAPFVVSPGDTASGWVDVKNVSQYSGDLQVSYIQQFEEGGTDGGFFDDVLIGGVPVSELEDGDILYEAHVGPGEVVRVDLEFIFPEEAVSGNSSGGFMQTEYEDGQRHIHTDVRLALTGDIPDEPVEEEPKKALEHTGVAIAGLAGLSALLIGSGSLYALKNRKEK